MTTILDLTVYEPILRQLEDTDIETRNHTLRMGQYSRLLGRALGLTDQQQELLCVAAPLHDIGKVVIPDRILLKPDRLTPLEWDIMMSHARAGYEILKESDSPVLRLGAEIALTHHEKYDGSGYPYGLHGQAIPLSGRIVAIADVFDALVSARPFKPAWRFSEVIDALRRGRSSHFDPILVDAFLDIIPEIQHVRHEFGDAEAA